MMEDLKQKLMQYTTGRQKMGNPNLPSKITTSGKRPSRLFLGNGRRWYDVYGSDGMHLR